MAESTDRIYRIYGLVQGVGFRPYVARLASEYGLSGWVRNDGGIVTMRLTGDKEAVECVLRRLSALDGGSSELSGARVDRVEEVDSKINVTTDGTLPRGSLPPSGAVAPRAGYTLPRSRVPDSYEPDAIPLDFRIISSTAHSDRLRVLPPDIATCAECERELYEPNNRRHRHPFISCVSCGPRYTIMQDIPYDREHTTMSGFALCPECGREYALPDDRRGYAQTTCCPECGPQVVVWDPRGSLSESETAALIHRAVRVLRGGGIVAIKDIGGYHLACDARNPIAIARLREFKARDAKPFAVMFRTIDEIKSVAEVSETEERLLTGAERPIVLLSAKCDTETVHKVKSEGTGRVYPSALGASNRIGAMLPCNPLQMLILDEISPLVMTSGNRGGEPICIDDEIMKGYLAEGGIDLVLSHDREIVAGLDDSILQVTRIPGYTPNDKIGEGNAGYYSAARDETTEIIQILRRARGYVPLPIDMGRSLPYDAFAAGGDLKAVFALGRDNYAYMSGHFGDLDDVRTAEARQSERERMQRLLGIAPTQSACDMHPNYVSALEICDMKAVATYSKRERGRVDPARGATAPEGGEDPRGSLEGIEQPHILHKIQHHHAHIAAVMAERHLTGRVLGLAYDGTGYGDDGTIWGGEALLCEGKDYERVGHLSEVILIGADEAARNAAQTSLLYAITAEGAGLVTADDIAFIRSRDDAAPELSMIRAALDNGIGVYRTTSMGRLFDAVAAMLDIASYNSYEGECAMRLQYAAERVEREYLLAVANEGKASEPLYMPRTGKSGYVAYNEKTEAYLIDGLKIYADLYHQLISGVSADILAWRFHAVIADVSAELCRRIADDRGIPSSELPIALGGGTMQNSLLLSMLIPALKHSDFTPYFNSLVPSGDGGLALGQLYLMTY